VLPWMDHQVKVQTVKILDSTNTTNFSRTLRKSRTNNYFLV
jgi:hypothetical protein